MDASARNLEYATIEEIYNMPEGKRAELIDGELYMMGLVKHLLLHLQCF